MTRRVVYFHANQPSFSIDTMDYTERECSQILFKDPDTLFSTYAFHGRSKKLMVIPDLSTDIILSLGKNQSQIQLYGPVNSCRISSIPEDRDIFGLRFKPGTSALFLGYAEKDLINVENEFVMPEFTKRVMENICSYDDFRTKTILVNRLFRDFVKERYHLSYMCFDTSLQNLSNAILLKIISDHGTKRVAQLAEEMGYSKRYLNRVFQQHFGMSIKECSRIVRFQAVLSLLQKNDKHPSVIAGELGYYDQSHFIHEIKELSGYTPKKLAEKIRRVTIEI